MNTIKISDIVIPKKFSNTYPSEEKLEKIRKYIIEHGNLDKPILLNGKELRDNYIRYLIAVELGIEEVPYITTQEYKEKPITYIVGKFENCDKEYTWKNNNNIPIKVGDKVLVKSKTKTGKNRAVVTVVRIFKSNDKKYLKHKPVIKKLKVEKEV